MTKGQGRYIRWIWILTVLGICIGCGKEANTADAKPAANPALSVAIVQPTLRQIPLTLTANGSIAAWQEAIIGAEVSDLRLAEVRAQVGDVVHQGQVLAVFADERVLAEVAQSRANLAEAEANLSEAQLNGDRARKISPSGALSSQQIAQYLTSERANLAKVQAAKAQLDLQLVRLKHTKVLASDDGVISSRSATLGAVATPGQELFRMIRKNRLEWRGEVVADELAQLKPGVAVSVEVAQVGRVDGMIRQLSPTLDPTNRNALVYVDLPDAAAHGLRVGMFARGEFILGDKQALTVPQEAVSLRDGFSYVFRLQEQNGEQAQVNQIKVQLGRRDGENLEIVSGINANDRLVASGVSFLANGDRVRVVQ